MVCSSGVRLGGLVERDLYRQRRGGAELIVYGRSCAEPRARSRRWRPECPLGTRAGVPAKRKPLPARPANTGTHSMKRTRTKAEEQAVERLREICLALPDVEEKIAWGELTWRV